MCVGGVGGGGGVGHLPLGGQGIPPGHFCPLFGSQLRMCGGGGGDGVGDGVGDGPGDGVGDGPGDGVGDGPGDGLGPGGDKGGFTHFLSLSSQIFLLQHSVEFLHVLPKSRQHFFSIHFESSPQQSPGFLHVFCGFLQNNSAGSQT
jgi:hypothetical protein